MFAERAEKWTYALQKHYPSLLRQSSKNYYYGISNVGTFDFFGKKSYRDISLEIDTIHTHFFLLMNISFVLMVSTYLLCAQKNNVFYII